MADQSRWVGRVALVTGGGAGIGAATARLLVEQGLRVVVCDKDPDRLKKLDAEMNTNPSNRCLLTIQCDISKEEQVLVMFQQIRSEYGQLDICINNAGGNKKNATLLEGSTEAWKAIFDTNVIGTSICTREAVKLMREKGIDDGHILFMGSFSGHRLPPGSEFFMYSASKFAVRALVECLRLDLRQLKSNIRVSSVSPGFVKTEFLKEVVDDYKAFYESIAGLSAEEVAVVIWNCINQPQNVQIHDVLLRPTQQQH